MRRIAELDALRGVAAVLIVLAHLGFLPESRWVDGLVDLFFVLSGYLITRNVLKYRGSPGFLTTFFTRRALRIWPAYYLALGVCLLLSRKMAWDQPPTAWPYYLTFTQGVPEYLGRPVPPFSLMFLHTWTLAIEEQFYILWPLLLRRGGMKWVAAVALTFAAVPPLMRVWGFSPFLLLSRCDGLALGSVLGVLLADRERVARHVGAYRAGFALVGLAALAVPPLVGLGLDGGSIRGVLPPALRLDASLFLTRACLVAFGLAGFVLCTQGHRLLKPLRDPRLCYFGLVSYGLYLYHPMVFAAVPKPYTRFVVRKLGVESPLLRDLAMLAVCFMLAELSRRYLEGPILAWKERLGYGRSAAAVSDGPALAPHGPHTPTGPHAEGAAPAPVDLAG